MRRDDSRLLVLFPAAHNLLRMDAPSSDGIEVLSYTKAGPPDLGSNARASTSSAAAVGRADASRRDDDLQFQPRRASPLKQRQLFNSPTPDMDETQKDSDDDEDVVVVSDVKRAFVSRSSSSPPYVQLTAGNHSQDRSDSEELPDLNQLRNALRIQDHNVRHPLALLVAGRPARLTRLTEEIYLDCVSRQRQGKSCLSIRTAPVVRKTRQPSLFEHEHPARLWSSFEDDDYQKAYCRGP